MVGSGAQPPAGGASLKEVTEPSRQEAVEYIASLLEDLRLMAQQAQIPFLAYLIGVALEEANDEKPRRD